MDENNNNQQPLDFNDKHNLAPIEIETKQPDLNNRDKVVGDNAFISAFNLGTDLEQEIDVTENNIETFRNKEQVFKPTVDKHIENKNNALAEAVNEKTYKTREEAELAIKHYKDNVIETKDEYSLDEINEMKLETYQLGGKRLETTEELFETLFNPQSANVEASYLAFEKLNDLTEKEGLINTTTSFVSEALAVKPLAQMYVGDLTNEMVIDKIRKLQAIEDPKKKRVEAVALTEEIYEKTNRNNFTTAFLVGQMFDPYYERNINNEVFSKAVDVFLLGGLADSVSLTKVGANASKNLAKGVSKGGVNAAKQINKALKRDPLNGMEQVGNSNGAAETIANILTEAKDNPNYMAMLERYSGFDEDTLIDLASISNAEELEALALSNPKLLQEYKTVGKLQEYLRLMKQASDELNLSDVIDSEAARRTITEGERTKFLEEAKTRMELDAANKLSTYNSQFDIETNLIVQEQANVIEAIHIGKTDKGLEEFKAQYPDAVLKEKVEIDIKAVQPLAPIKDRSKLDVRDLKYGEFAISPENLLSHGIDYGEEAGGVTSIVNDITALKNQGQTLLSEVKPVIKQVNKNVKKLSKKQKKLLTQVLREGDEYIENGINVGKDFSYMELVNKGLDEKAIKSYMEYRTVADELFKLNNKMKYDELKIKGYGEYKITLDSQFAKQLNNSKTTAYNIVNDQISQLGIEVKGLDNMKKIKQDFADQFVYVEGGQQVRKMGDLTNEELAGLKFVRLNNSIGMNGDPVKFILTQAEKNPLPLNVLQRRKGYIPRKYEARHYIYKLNEYGDPEVLSGVVRASDLKKELAAIQKQNQGTKLFTRLEGQDITTAKSSNAFSNYDVNLESNLSFSNNVRKKTLLTDSQNNRLRTKNPFDALSDQLQAAAVTKPLVKYRAALIERVDKTLTLLAEAEGKNLLKNPANILEGIKKEFLPEYNKYQQIINYVNKQLVDTGDKHFEAYSRTMRNAVNFLDDKAGKVLPTKINKALDKLFDNNVIGLHDLEKYNPIEGLKTITFVRLLGLFDPRQVLLQSLQTLSIMSISPKYGSIGVRDYTMWKLMKKNFRRDLKALEPLMKKSDTDLKDMEAAVIDLKQSNLLQSINTNDDLKLQSNGVFSRAKDGLNTVIDKGMYFYDLGNEMVYSTAFFAARREILKGASRRLTPEEMIKVQDRANRLAYNYTSANKAGFQDGIFSLSTQFMQVPAKAFESLISTQLTTPEKIRLLAGQGLFFGYAGVPMGQAFTGYLMQTLNTSEDEVLNKYAGAINDFENGVVGNLFSTLFGYDVSTTNLQFFGANVTDIPFYPILKELRESNDMVSSSRIIAEAMGPSFDTVSKGQNLLANTYRLFNNFAVGNIDEGYAVARANFFSSNSNLAKFFGTTNKLGKAIMVYELGEERDSFGNVLVRYEDDDKLGRAVGAMLGLNNIEVEKSYMMIKQKQLLEDKERFIKETAKEFFDMGMKSKDFEATKNMFMSFSDKMNINQQTAEEIWENVGYQIMDRLADDKVSNNVKNDIIEAMWLFKDPDKELSTEYRNEMYKMKRENNNGY